MLLLQHTIKIQTNYNKLCKSCRSGDHEEAWKQIKM